MTPAGLITLEIDGMRASEIERLQKILHLIILNGVLSLKKGQMTLHFDENGNLETIERVLRWRAKDHQKSTPL